jgi:hypothetical protein
MSLITISVSNNNLIPINLTAKYIVCINILGNINSSKCNNQKQKSLQPFNSVERHKKLWVHLLFIDLLLFFTYLFTEYLFLFFVRLFVKLFQFRHDKCPSICILSNCYKIVQQAAKKSDLIEVGPKKHWNLLWTDATLTVQQCRDLKRYQGCIV